MLLDQNDIIQFDTIKKKLFRRSSRNLDSILENRKKWKSWYFFQELPSLLSLSLLYFLLLGKEEIGFSFCYLVYVYIPIPDYL